MFSPPSLASRAMADNLHWLACQPKLVRGQRAKVGADDQNRTGDLVLTKDALCQLSYIGLSSSVASHASPVAVFAGRRRARPDQVRSRKACKLERETGIEPATNSLEGCDSTTELLPPLPIRPTMTIIPPR